MSERLLDWPGLMRAGMQGLGLRPGEFWRLTPAELWLMLGAGAGPARLDRAGLDDLLRRYPDKRKDEGDDRKR